MRIPAPLAILSNFFAMGQQPILSPAALDTQSPLHIPEPAVAGLPSCDSYSVRSKIESSSYDYLVVGAGAGGGPISARLAEQGWRVLVIEAGIDVWNLNTTIPLYGAVFATEDPKISLNYYVNHYPKGDQYENVRTWYPRAQGLGGCVIHNDLINVIPHKWDFETLADMFQDESWRWQNMAPYYTRVENNLWMPSSVGLPIGHGYAGWMSTQLPPTNLLTDPQFYDPQLLDVLTAIRTAREPVVNEDFNDWRNDLAEGGAWVELTKQANGTRSSVRDRLVAVHDAYPERLKFAFESWATKVLTCRTREGGVRAYGVEAWRGSHLNPVASNFRGKGKGVHQVKQWYAKNEVILSAGPFETPKLLMHSGIGDRKHLSEYGIQTLVHSPGVGQNLQDRVEETTVWTLKQNHKIFQNCTFQTDPNADPCLAEWFADGHKNLYSAGSAIYAWSYKSLPSLPYRDIWSFWGPAAFFGYFPGWSKKTLEYPNAILNVVLKAHTAARGWVKLTGPHPQDTLEINKNEYQTSDSKYDFKAVAESMMSSKEFVANSTLFNQHVSEQIWPDSGVQSEQQYQDFVKKNQWGHHACCTAKMGTNDDPYAVLNGRFQVRGVENLRVVDLSIYPYIPGMFVTTPMYMVSEKAADVIIEDVV